MTSISSCRQRRHGIADAPERLNRRMSRARLWRAPGLVFGQTCGFPLTHGYAASLELVATPCYAAAGCAGILRESH